MGYRGLSELEDGRVIFARIEGTAIEVEVPGAAPAAGDARVLTIQRGALGRRRDWASVVNDCEEEAYEDFLFLDLAPWGGASTS